MILLAARAWPVWGGAIAFGLVLVWFACGKGDD